MPEPLSRIPTPRRGTGPFTLFGYRHVTGVPMCPCGDPGNYMMLEQVGLDPLVCQFRCWCGARLAVTFESLQERSDFLAAHR